MDSRQAKPPYPNIARVKRFLRSEIGAAAVWVFCSLLLAALISPWLYQGGKWLGANAAANDLPRVLEWLGAACARSKFGRFFDRSLLISALALLPLLFRRIKSLRRSGDAVPVSGPRPSAKSAAVQVIVACLISGGILWGLGGLLRMSGAYVPEADAPSFGKLLSKILLPAVAASLLEEWLFRGVLLGLWLRFAKPAAACIGTSLLFAFLHFMQPPDGVVIANPAHFLAGFELLGKILLHFTDPLFFVTDFATLLAVGLILAMARVRTGALWFSIGLHAGWIMSFKAFSLLFEGVTPHYLRPWGVGDNLRSGLLPLLALAFTAGVCHFVLKHFDLNRASPSPRRLS